MIRLVVVIVLSSTLLAIVGMAIGLPPFLVPVLGFPLGYVIAKWSLARGI